MVFGGFPRPRQGMRSENIADNNVADECGQSNSIQSGEKTGHAGTFPLDKLQELPCNKETERKRQPRRCAG